MIKKLVSVHVPSDIASMIVSYGWPDIEMVQLSDESYPYLYVIGFTNLVSQTPRRIELGYVCQAKFPAKDYKMHYCEQDQHLYVLGEKGDCFRRHIWTLCRENAHDMDLWESFFSFSPRFADSHERLRINDGVWNPFLPPHQHYLGTIGQALYFRLHTGAVWFLNLTKPQKKWLRKKKSNASQYPKERIIWGNDFPKDQKWPADYPKTEDDLCIIVRDPLTKQHVLWALSCDHKLTVYDSQGYKLIKPQGLEHLFGRVVNMIPLLDRTHVLLQTSLYGRADWYMFDLNKPSQPPIWSKLETRDVLAFCALTFY